MHHCVATSTVVQMVLALRAGMEENKRKHDFPSTIIQLTGSLFLGPLARQMGFSWSYRSPHLPDSSLIWPTFNSKPGSKGRKETSKLTTIVLDVTQVLPFFPNPPAIYLAVLLFVFCAAWEREAFPWVFSILAGTNK